MWAICSSASDKNAIVFIVWRGNKTTIFCSVLRWGENERECEREKEREGRDRGIVAVLEGFGGGGWRFWSALPRDPKTLVTCLVPPRWYHRLLFRRYRNIMRRDCALLPVTGFDWLRRLCSAESLRVDRELGHTLTTLFWLLLTSEWARGVDFGTASIALLRSSRTSAEHLMTDFTLWFFFFYPAPKSVQHHYWEFNYKYGTEFAALWCPWRILILLLSLLSP